ncbi:hypothetical protein [Streptomyces sp. CBMA152]|uniref:hypothetical protein n=1 Tax=Streptomyces sp. CBMA152 TaxID=1896312 RepID=UPI001660754A|nr:hypothetical protein [Streptomyces sp. CBMA152]
MRAAGRISAVALAGTLVLAGCADGNSVPSLPKSICWQGEFAGSTVSPLLPKGDKAQVKMPDDPVFDVFEHRTSTYCSVFVDGGRGRGRESFLAWAQVRRSGRGTEWNHWGPRSTSRISVGDEGFLWATGAASVILCERPDLPRGAGYRLYKDQKYVELALVAEDAPDTRQTRETFTSLLTQYVQFAKRELKCANGA